MVHNGVMPAKQTDALRGYAYQVVAATLAWLNLKQDSYLILEVAEDYAIIANGALQTVQVKDTARSGPVRLGFARCSSR